MAACLGRRPSHVSSTATPPQASPPARRGHAEIAMRKIRENLVDTHIAFVYEGVGLERLWELNAERAWPFTFKRAGRWWDN